MAFIPGPSKQFIEAVFGEEPMMKTEPVEEVRQSVVDEMKFKLETIRAVWPDFDLTVEGESLVARFTAPEGDRRELSVPNHESNVHSLIENCLREARR